MYSHSDFCKWSNSVTAKSICPFFNINVSRWQMYLASVVMNQQRELTMAFQCFFFSTFVREPPPTEAHWLGSNFYTDLNFSTDTLGIPLLLHLHRKRLHCLTIRRAKMLQIVGAIPRGFIITLGKAQNKSSILPTSILTNNFQELSCSKDLPLYCGKMATLYLLGLVINLFWCRLVVVWMFRGY